MAASAPKRQRASTDGTARPPFHDMTESQLDECIDCLDTPTAHKLLKQAARAHGDVASAIKAHFGDLVAAEGARVVSFDHLSKSVWSTLNVTYARTKASDFYEMAGQAAEDVEASIELISNDCPAIASFGTKENALETLRKMAKSICLSTGIVPREVRKDYHCGGMLLPLMLRIAGGLTAAERERLSVWIEDKLVELEGIAEDYGGFEGLDEVIEVLRWGEGGGDEDDGDGEGGDEGADESDEVELGEEGGDVSRTEAKAGGIQYVDLSSSQ